MEILDGFVCIVFCFLQNGSGLIVGIFQEFFFALINIFLLFLEFIAQLADFFFVALNLHLLLFQGDAAVFQFGDDVFKVDIFGAQMVSLASSMRKSGRPRREEIANALLFPGIPIRRR